MGEATGKPRQGPREVGAGGMASFKGTVPAVPGHGSTCVCLSHDSG